MHEKERIPFSRTPARHTGIGLLWMQYEGNAPKRAHHHIHAVHRNITSIFAGTTCSFDATLIKRPAGFPFSGL